MTSAAVEIAKARVASKETKVSLPIWEPWKEFSVEPEVLPISGPPCASCFFWKPMRRFNPEYNSYIGVRLCHNTEMAPDFSCFNPKATP